MVNDLSTCLGEMAFGPWGYDGGSDWSFKPKYSKQAGNITQITIRCDDDGLINSIMFKGESHGDYSAQFGGGYAAPLRTSKIDIDFPSEFLTGISGTYHDTKVRSLHFQTNKKEYHGAFGRSGFNDTAFSVNSKGGAITGFHGRCGVGYISAIGVYVMPDCLLKCHDVDSKQHQEIASSSGLSRFLSPPRGAGPRGSDGGRDWDDGVFSAVKGVEVVVGTETVSAVRFCYLTSDGSDFMSPFHGGHSGGKADIKTISFDNDDDEHLISIEGFYGLVKGVNVITSLTFITNKVRYGPVGIEIGAYFTFVNSDDCNRKVVGFHGRSGAYLDAIGLHTEYMMNNSIVKKKVKEEKN